MMNVGLEYEEIVAAVNNGSVEEDEITKRLEGYEADFINKLLQHQGVDEDFEPQFLICEVMRNKRIGVAKLLLSHGADPYQHDTTGDCVVDCTKADCHVDLMSILISQHKERKINLCEPDLSYFTKTLETLSDVVCERVELKSALKKDGPPRTTKKVTFVEPVQHKSFSGSSASASSPSEEGDDRCFSPAASRVSASMPTHFPPRVDNSQEAASAADALKQGAAVLGGNKI
jgi:hypothetical protein